MVEVAPPKGAETKTVCKSVLVALAYASVSVLLALVTKVRVGGAHAQHTPDGEATAVVPL